MSTLQKLKILILEDMAEDAELIIRSMQKGGINFDFERVDTRETFVNEINNFQPDIILSDHSLPQFNSMEALEICKQSNSPIPFILVTGTVSEEFAVSCIKRGADDYILKSNLTRLPIAIINALNQRKLEISKHNSENELREQNLILMKVNKELDNFAYNVSHNLRAPLASVLGLINLIKIEDHQKDEKTTELISMMEYSVKKLDKTLVNILNYSRNSRIESIPDQVDIHAILEDCIKEMMYMEGTNKIVKNLHISNSIPFYSDKYRVSVIVNNLLSNAIKYADLKKANSYINIDITIDKESMEMIFEDNGIGINKELQPHIYNMFFRATEKSDGAGLGLYIVKEMIDRLKGEINISSVKDIGTKVSVTIPNNYQELISENKS